MIRGPVEEGLGEDLEETKESPSNPRESISARDESARVESEESMSEEDRVRADLLRVHYQRVSTIRKLLDETPLKRVLVEERCERDLKLGVARMNSYKGRVKDFQVTMSGATEPESDEEFFLNPEERAKEIFVQMVQCQGNERTAQLFAQVWRMAEIGSWSSFKNCRDDPYEVIVDFLAKINWNLEDQKFQVEADRKWDRKIHFRGVGQECSRIKVEWATKL